MPNRIERILRAVSLGLAAILVLQLALLVVRRNPLKGLEIPRAPQWTEESARAGTNSPPSTATNRTGTTLESKPPAAPTPGRWNEHPAFDGSQSKRGTSGVKATYRPGARNEWGIRVPLDSHHQSAGHQFAGHQPPGRQAQHDK